MDPAALAAMFGGAGGGGAGGGGGAISREQAAAFAQMMSGMAAAAGGSGGHPAHTPAPAREPTPEELEAEKERYIQEYAKYLEELKTRDPQEYKEIMTELANAARQAKAGFEPVMPGGERKMGAGGVDSAKPEEGLEVTPEPGFVVKTSNAGGVKVFINVCKSEHIKPPSKKKQLQPDGTEQEGMNIPLSLGPPNPITTKRGEKALVFDCIVNDAVIEDCTSDRTGSFRHFVCELCIQYVEQKYKTQLNHQYKLPQSKYKGPRQTQMIRKRQAPVIEEVEDDDAASGTASGSRSGRGGSHGGAKGAGLPKAASRASGSRTSAPKRAGSGNARVSSGSSGGPVIRVKEPNEHAKYSVMCVDEAGGEPYKWEEQEDAPAGAQRHPVQIVVTLRLDKMPDDELPLLDIAEEMLVMKATGYFPLDIYLPLPVHADSPEVRADMDRAASTLVVSLPVADVSGRTTADPGSKPWLLSRALAAGSADDDDSRTSSKATPAAGLSASTAYGASGAPVTEEDVLPEDRFHKSDIVSQHLLMERAKERAARKKKQAEKDAREAAEKAKKEEEERAQKAADEEAAREAAIAAAVADDADPASGDLDLSTSMAFDLLD